MKVVLDTNVLLAAFGRGGVCREVVEACLLVHRIQLSEFILSEFRRKLVEKFGGRRILSPREFLDRQSGS